MMQTRRKHFKMDDRSWDAFKEYMAYHSQEALERGAYRHARKVKEQPFAVTPQNTPFSCPSYCPECAGKNYVENPSTGELSECSRFRSRMEKAGVPDPSQDNYRDVTGEEDVR